MFSFFENLKFIFKWIVLINLNFYKDLAIRIADFDKTYPAVFKTCLNCLWFLDFSNSFLYKIKKMDFTDDGEIIGLN